MTEITEQTAVTHSGRMGQKGLSSTALILLALVFSLLALFSPLTSANAPHQILVLHSYHTEYPWTKNLKRGIENEFQDLGEEAELYHEFMDTKRYPSQEKRYQFIRHLGAKYSDTSIDLLLVSDDAALQTLLVFREQYFANIPVVFLGINNIREKYLTLPLATGVFENHDLATSMKEIKRLSGRNDLVIVLNALSSSDQRGRLDYLIKNTAGIPENITIIRDLSEEQIQNYFQSISPKTPVFVIGQLLVREGSRDYLGWNHYFAALKKHIDNPIYTTSRMGLGQGAVGVNFLSAQSHGRQAAQLAKQVLRGTPVDMLPAITDAQSQWGFDVDLLVKHDIPMTKIPKGSQLINRRGEFYKNNKNLVHSVVAAFVVAFIIIVLLSAAYRRVVVAKRMIEENESRYRDLATTGANIFWETDARGHLTYLSGDTQLAYGFKDLDLLGRSLVETLVENREIDFPLREFQTRFEVQEPLDKLSYKVKLANHEVKIFQLSGKPIYDAQRNFIGYRGISREITQEHHLSETIAYQASYDALTGLVNRPEFNNRLKDLVENPQVFQGTSFLCFLDLDRFKLVNDTAGHLVGDRMLTEIANTINACIRRKDVLGRLGGDEFGLLLVNTSLEEAKAICNRVIREVESHRFQWDNRIFEVGVSIGMIAIHGGLNEEELLSRSDFACYKAKEQGRGRIYIVDEKQGDFDQDHLQMGYIANVTQAIEQRRFSLVRQKIEDTSPQALSHHHYEILLRYKDEDGNPVSPGDFIPFAEKHGVISIIDRWVLETAINSYERYFPDKGTMISINLSGISISNEEFVRFAEKVVKSATMDPCLLCFEITETAAISHLSQALDFIHTMKRLGVKFALDDFGCGSSSFGYLKNLPVDYVKIDGSLVKNIATEPSDRAIVTAVHSIAEMMQMKTIAEFVENEEIRTVLADIGVDYVQGYGIGRPEECQPQLKLVSSKRA